MKLLQPKLPILALIISLLGITSCLSVTVNNSSGANPTRLVSKLSAFATGWIYSLAWAPDNVTLAVGSREGKLRLWDTLSKNIQTEFQGYTGSVNQVAWSPSGKYLATGSQEISDTVRIWNVNTHQVLFHATPAANTLISGLAWSPDNKKLVVGLESNSETNRLDGILIYDPFGPQTPIITKEASPVTTVAWEPNGMVFAFGLSPLSGQPGTIKLGKISAKEPRLEITNELLGHSSRINNIGWSPDTKLIASVSDDETVKLWNASNGQEVATFNYGNDPKSIAWSPDSKRLAVGGWAEPTIKVWDVSTRQLSITLDDPDSVNTIAWSPDGTHLASGDLSGIVWIWDVK